MRLIDADALKDKLKQHHDFYVMAWGGFGKMPIGEKKRVDEITNCIAEVVNAPTIEAEWVDLVTCAECRRVREDGGHANCRGYLYCRKWKTLVDEDCYCSWGERRD